MLPFCEHVYQTTLFRLNAYGREKYFITLVPLSPSVARCLRQCGKESRLPLSCSAKHIFKPGNNLISRFFATLFTTMNQVVKWRLFWRHSNWHNFRLHHIHILHICFETFHSAGYFYPKHHLLSVLDMTSLVHFDGHSLIYYCYRWNSDGLMIHYGLSCFIWGQLWLSWMQIPFWSNDFDENQYFNCISAEQCFHILRFVIWH